MFVFELIKDEEFRNQYINHLKDNNTNQSEYLFSNEYIKDIERLQSGDYFLSPPTKLSIFKNNKQRIVYKYNDKEKAIFGIINYALHKYDDCFSKCCFSHVINHPIKQIFRTIANNQTINECYVSIMDVKKFGDSVDRDILNQRVDELIKNDIEINNFLHLVINDQRCFEDGVLTNSATAIKSGNQLTQFLEDVYLLPFDKKMVDLTVAYYRYCDDFIFFAKDQNTINSINDFVFDYMKNNKLIINENKVKHIKPHESYKIFGVTFIDNTYQYTELINHYKKYIGNKRTKAFYIKKKYGLSGEEAMKWFVKTLRFDDKETINALIKDIDNVDTLKVLDDYIQDSIRQMGSDKRTSSKYRIKYEDIKKAGYYSLVNEYYNLIG